MVRCSKCGAEYPNGPHTCGQAGIQTMLVDEWDGEDARIDESSSYEIGAVIGQYRLLSLVGEGAIGRVYLAEHMELGRRVALKILRSEFAKKSSVVERFFGEARAVNQIHHENIVEITDFVRADEYGRSYYIMELLEGQTLKQLLDELKVIPVDRALAIARQICSALEAVHAKGIVHRDLKPENIFLTQREGREFVKLLDFGAAKLSHLGDKRVRHQTLIGALVGTPRYMAPEQTFGGAVDHRADVYALGVLLYEMVSGVTPFDGENTTELLLKHRNDEPPALAKELPQSVTALIGRCLQKSPDQRPQNMAEVRSAMETWQPKRSRAPAIAVGTTLLLLAGAVAAYSLPKQPIPQSIAAPPALPPPPPPAPALVNITFRSKPDGATVLVAGAHVGVTPMTAQLRRSTEPVSYELQLERYAPLKDELRPTEDSTVEVVLSQIPPKQKPRASSKRIKKRRVARARPVAREAPRAREEQPPEPPKKEIGLGDVRDPFSDK